MVKFHWEAVSPNGEVTAVRLDFLILATDGRLRRDYTFIESLAMYSTVQSFHTWDGVIATVVA